MHPNLLRLDDLAVHVATDPHVQAVLGLGSAGVQTHRFDDHSDIDFFLVQSDDIPITHPIISEPIPPMPARYLLTGGCS